MLNKIKLKSSKIMTQKKIIIGVLCSLFFICTSFHSSLIYADSITSGSGTFTYGRYEYQKNIYSSITNINIDGTSINSYGTIIIDVYLNNTYTGNLYINGISSSGMMNGGSYYCYGASFSSFNTSNNRILLLVNEPTDHIKVIYTVNGSDMHTFITNANVGVSGSMIISEDTSTALSNIDIKLSSCSNTLQQILTALQSGGSIYEFLDDIESYVNNIQTSNNNLLTSLEFLNSTMNNTISYFLYQENFNSSGYTYFTETINDLGTNKYTRTTSDARSINRIGIFFNTSSMINGNYFVIQYYFMCSSSLSNNAFKKYVVSIRDSSNLVITVNEHYDYYFTYYNSNVNKSVYVMSIYVPLYYMAEYQNGTYYVDINGISLPNVLTSKITFIGIVENLPDITPYNAEASETSQNIVSVADDIANTSSDINDVEQQYINDLNDFNNNLDLSDYNFNLTNRTGFEYLREKLTDIYEINEFKPFYLVPIIFFVLTIVLGG